MIPPKAQRAAHVVLPHSDDSGSTWLQQPQLFMVIAELIIK